MRPIVIVGGGLAGLTLGIGLRRRKVPVQIYEAGVYPRHRVCGEFVSGRGQQVLARLGLQGPLIYAGGTMAHTASFFVGRVASPVRLLAQPAFCLSRYKMDAVLAREFRRLGGDLHENRRWTGDLAGEGVVRACGRRRQSVESGWCWFGLKAHARAVSLGADLEMHACEAGYVGICRLDGAAVNVCGLFRRRASGTEGAPRPRERLRGLPGSVLHGRFEQVVWEESSFCSVAALPLRPRRACATSDCCIGDALTMIPPVTGNGMSMAFEAADLALAPLISYSAGEREWPAARAAVAEACDRAFARRLAWAKWLQWFMFAGWLHGGVARVLLGSDWLWNLMFARTR